MTKQLPDAPSKELPKWSLKPKPEKETGLSPPHSDPNSPLVQGCYELCYLFTKTFPTVDFKYYLYCSLIFYFHYPVTG